MYAWTPMLLAETSTGLWLLVKSVKLKTAHSTGAAVSLQYWD